MSWLFVSDSSINMFQMEALPEGVAYTTVPLTIRGTDREFVDDSNLNVKEMLDYLDSQKGPSGTACPAPDVWAEKFRQADNIIAITISSNLSGSYNSAMIAAEMVEEECPGKNIHVIDSLSTGAEMTMLLRKALSLVAEGRDFKTVVAETEKHAQSIHLLFVLCSFENLVKNGRMSRLTGFMAGALGMRAVGRASSEGRIDMFAKARGEARALAVVLEEMDHTGYNGGTVIIDHVFNPKAAHLLAHGITAKWPDAKIEVRPCGGLCSFYAQNEGMIIGYEC